MYNVVLVSAVQQSDSYTYTYILSFLDSLPNGSLLSRVPCAIKQRFDTLKNKKKVSVQFRGSVMCDSL